MPNRIEGDHAALKRLLRLGKGFKTMRSAKTTIRAIETHRMIKNNHIRNIEPGITHVLCGEIDFVQNLFQDAA